MEPKAKNRQIEFEVFPKDKKSSYSYLSDIKEDTRNEPAAIHVTFSHQSVIVIFICFLMFLIASFTVGVEKGKLIAKSSVAKEEVELRSAEDSTSEAVEVKPAVQTPVVAEQKDTLPEGNYSIQVASLKTQESAKSLSDSLSNKGLFSFTRPSGKYIIVLAGNFERKEEAKVTLQELKKTFNDCFIRKI